MLGCRVLICVNIDNWIQFHLEFSPLCVHVNFNYHFAKNCLFMGLCVKMKTHANRAFRTIPLQIRRNWFSFFFIDFQGWNQQHEMQCTHDNFIQSKYPFECYAGNDTILASAFQATPNILSVSFLLKMLNFNKAQRKQSFSFQILDLSTWHFLFFFKWQFQPIR